MSIVLIGSLIGLLVIGLLVGVLAGHFVLTPADRRRLDAMTDRMLAELHIAAATQATLAEMRKAVREAGRR